eukprot:CAMPEP_0184969802 /NCGR_PEP_ID=MMETSP1098-20130426/2453_1 /TAXON_ID=89044 /ORGANISM="Spumella elongata, Strain CCAP 955/1" /LENGTH=389 /DNA_ID=CAMNT_0027491621 /DNA_START=49 /DNA_END=1218 /DNA_ORIENTATION=+
MNFHQQQQMAMAQQMAAQQGQYGGGMTPQQQQQLAMAQQMGGLTPQQQQQIAMAQQMAAQYGGQPMGAAPGYAPPMAPIAAAPAADGTTITCQFPDGCLIGYDRLRNELILNGKISNTRMRQIPARPSPSYGADVDEGPGVPVEKTGMMTKLGWKKTVMGGDSWQPRFFRLTDTHISYHKDPSGPAINSIPLNNGIVVNVVNAATPARKNRYENNDTPGVGTLMTMNIGAMKSETSGPIGRENCVEMIVPGQIGTMLDGVMSQNAVGLAFGGGMAEMKKQGQGRTYYMSCNSRLEADEWRAAIQNNVKCLPVGPMPTSGEIGGANGYSGINNMMNSAMAMKNTMGNMNDPQKSLEWYKTSLGTQLTNDQVFALLSKFYDELDRAGVRHA